MSDSIEKIAGEIMQQVLYGATVDWRPNMAQIAQRLRELDSLRQVPEVDAMVSRFLGWPIPKTFAPDCGISFTPLAHPNGWPIGTNLLTDAEARAMFEYVLDVQEADPAPSTSDPKAHECGWPKCECASESRETCIADELNDIANPAPPTSGDPLSALADDEAERLQYERDKRDPANCLTDATPAQAGAELPEPTGAGMQTPEGQGALDRRSVPANCRERLCREGKPFPRRGCAACGKFAPKWRECDTLLAAEEILARRGGS